MKQDLAKILVKYTTIVEYVFKQSGGSNGKATAEKMWIAGSNPVLTTNVVQIHSLTEVMVKQVIWVRTILRNKVE